MITSHFYLDDIRCSHQFLVAQHLPYDGILGFDFLKKYNAVIDSAGNKMYVNNIPIMLLKGKLEQVPIKQRTNALSVDSIIENHREVFSNDLAALNKCHTIEHKIDIDSNYPIKQACRRLPTSLKSEVEAQINEMLTAGIIRKSCSPWASPIVMVKKKDGNHRMCIDYRKLNAITKKDCYPIPRIDDVLELLQGSTVFSTLDMKAGYWQISMAEKDKEKTAFITPFGLFEFNVMPFGLSNSPATFQRFMEHILRKYINTTCIVYLDDVLIFSKDQKKHLKDVNDILNEFKSYGLTLSEKKCRFNQTQIKYLGYIVSKEGVSVDKKEVEAIRNYPRPKSPKEVQRFIGLINFYRKFIKGCSSICQPLYSLIRKDTEFIWNNKCDESFNELKRRLLCTPILSHPDFSKKFTLTTDASDVAIGAVLSQQHPNKAGVIAYYSRVLSPAERNYSVFEKEALAIISAIKEFRHYLYGFEFEVQTDHNPLCFLQNIKDCHGRIARWFIFLQEYNFKVTYKKGKTNLDADALSRINPTCNFMTRMNDEVDLLLKEYLHDENIKQIKQKLNHTKNQYRTKRGLFCMDRSGKILRKIILPTGEEIRQVVVPGSLRSRYLTQVHDDMFHPGYFKTFSNLRDYYYWPGYQLDVRKYVQSCKICQKFNYHGITNMDLDHFTVNEPLESWHCDVVGPLPETKRGNRFIFTMVDPFSKWAEAFALPDTTTNTITTTLTHVFSRFGIPKIIHTDQGTNFVSGSFKRFCDNLNVIKTETTAYHPQGNGQVERFNRTMKNMLKKSHNALADWDLSLPHLLRTYRNTYHESIGMCPAEVVFGKKLNTSQNNLERKHRMEAVSASEYTKPNLQRIHTKRKIAQKNIQKTIQRMDKYHKATRNTELEVDNMVWLLDPRKIIPKLEPRWLGPYRITRIRGNVIEIIDNNNQRQKVHKNRLKKMVENNFTNDNHPTNLHPQVSTEIDDEPKSDNTYVKMYENEEPPRKRPNYLPHWLKDYVLS